MRSPTQLLYQNEAALHKRCKLVAGVDEAGRGPIAGPVVVAAVILNSQDQIDGINDSKQLSAKKREQLFDIITEKAMAYSIIEISHQRIDEINILQAVLEGMRQAVESLSERPGLCLIDGNKLPCGLKVKARACIKGDATYASIAAASILAKVHRDRIMRAHDISYPVYGFSRHKGYPTVQHLQALREYGPCPIHRLSYAPLKQLELALK
ncbi:MAG: ribonuclease HII [Candidatus Cloacimonadaceae bacterium]